MRLRRWGVRSLMLSVALGVGAPEVDAQGASRAVADLLRYQAPGVGHWRQENSAREAGSEAPVFWVRQLRWGPARDVVIADAFAVYEDRRCESVAHMVYYWDVGDSRVAVTSFSPGGVVGMGHLQVQGSGEVRLDASVRLTDGSELRIRDTSDETERTHYTTRTERLVDGDWIAGDAVVWRRTPGPSPCE